MIGEDKNDVCILGNIFMSEVKRHICCAGKCLRIWDKPLIRGSKYRKFHKSFNMPQAQA